MISRTWHGRVPAAKADAYHTYLLRTGLADYQSTPGNVGLLVERWVDDDVAHFLLTTVWDSLEAIKRFAGEDYELARYYPEDDRSPRGGAALRAFVVSAGAALSERSARVGAARRPG
jgi:heme-degrading monooxygenase HmoA